MKRAASPLEHAHLHAKAALDFPAVVDLRPDCVPGLSPLHERPTDGLSIWIALLEPRVPKRHHAPADQVAAIWSRAWREAEVPVSHIQFIVAGLEPLGHDGLKDRAHRPQDDQGGLLRLKVGTPSSQTAGVGLLCHVSGSRTSIRVRCHIRAAK